MEQFHLSHTYSNVRNSFLSLCKNEKSPLLFSQKDLKFVFPPLFSVLEASFFPNCISDPTKIPPFQSPPYPFMNREGCDP